MEYRVLARTYRPATFADLIGQEALVRTLSNAIASGRIAHAFLLTGIRGVGKTTTARIIARALNCEKGPTADPCGVCAHCASIAEDRHVDVLEMDAASHTGVADIRELIDTVRYLPASARYKIYIIDEVHMLSTSAFNALLKTLEEPPPHAKFIFATTESRKIPVTILSRCQRFDLKRVETDMLAKHLANIAGREKVVAEDEALKLIAVAAEGSVRDALSLLDQAIAHDKNITAEAVRKMIGSADNTVTFRLLEALLKGEVAETLALVRQHYMAGADPLSMVQDCLEVTHLVTRVKVAPEAAGDVSLSPHDREAAKSLAGRIGMPELARLWQMLLKGLSEVRVAPSPVAALEMLLVRVAYAAQLPTPAEIISSLPHRGRDRVGAGLGDKDAGAPQESPPPNLPPTGGGIPKGEGIKLVTDMPANFAEAVALFDKHREPLLYTRLRQDARLVEFAAGSITLRLTASLPRDFTARVAECLSGWTGQKWKVTLSQDEGTPSLHEQVEARKREQTEAAAGDPLVAKMLEQFPGAKVTGVKTT